ncbi:hypothetical protein EG827_08535 [bacterium]|jgi:hypothetical protein|nr:hypothetical protein [bacterium]
MKTKMTLILAAIILFGGCGLIKDAATVTIDTDLTSSATVVVDAKKSADAFTAGEYSFTKTEELRLDQNTDIKPYLEKIREIKLNSLEITITGLLPGQVISTISLDVDGAGNVCTQTNVSSANNTFTPTVTAATFKKVADVLTSTRKITYTIHGFVNMPGTFVITTTYGAKVTAGALD